MIPTTATPAASPTFQRVDLTHHFAAHSLGLTDILQLCDQTETQEQTLF